jgi:nifR3 family TIM-barrel protein
MLGAEFTLCEVLLDKFVTQVSPRKAKYYYGVEDQDHPCGAQLMGAEPAQFVAAANKLVDAGFDLIDLNFACPVKKVLGKCRGGYLLTAPDTALKIVEAVRTSIPSHIPLTLKLRKGFDDTTESRDRFYQIIDGAIERGIDGITLHGRTVKQRYEGESDWNFLAEVKQYLTHEKKTTIPLIGSGDLFDAKTSVQHLKESKLDGLALARGIIGNPWLFQEVKAVLNSEPIPAPPDIKEQRRVIEAHFQQAINFYGEKRGIPVMRGFGIKYANKHTVNPNELRQAYTKFKTVKDWDEIMERFYE